MGILEELKKTPLELLQSHATRIAHDDSAVPQTWDVWTIKAGQFTLTRYDAPDLWIPGAPLFVCVGVDESTKTILGVQIRPEDYKPSGSPPNS
jgi:hypothetical protein